MKIVIDGILKIYNAKMMMAILATLSLASDASAFTNSGDGSWMYYRDITVTNANGNLTDYQVLVNLTNANFPINANSNGTDIRFSDTAGAELSYWIESWNYMDRNAKIWVKMTNISTGITTVRMYYGNPSARSLSNGVNTFISFDDFEDNVLTGWEKDFILSDGTGSTLTEQNQRMEISLSSGGTNNKNLVAHKKGNASSDSLVIEVDFVGPVGDKDRRATLGFSYGIDNQNWLVAKFGTDSRPGNDHSIIQILQKLNSQTTMLSTSGDWNLPDRSAGGKLQLIIDKVNHILTVKYILKNSVDILSTNSYSSSFDTWPLYTSIGVFSEWNSGISVYLDNFRIRKYAPSEPSLTIGPENPVLSTITVSPSPVLIKVGNTQTFTATPEDQSGNPVSTTVTWSSSNTSVGTIDPNTGVFTAKVAGTTTVDATSGNVMGSASVVVTPAETPVASDGFRFVQLTDIHIGPDIMSCAGGGLKSCIISYAESIIRFINVREDISKSVRPNFVLITGDSVEWNTANQYPVFNKLISKFNDVNIDVYIVPGNHDRRGQDFPVPNTFFPSNDLTNYEKYIVNDTKYDMSDRYFDQETYRFIGLDSGSDPELAEPIIEGDLRKLYNLIMYPNGSGLSKEQIDFTNDISTNRTIIFMHHPVVDDSCKSNSCNVITDNRDLLIGLAKNKHAKLVLTGHTHESKYLTDEGDKIPVSGRDTIRPLFIQTRSATKEFPLGYLIINTDETGEHIKEKLITESSTDYIIAFLESPADQHVYDESGGHTGINDTGGIDNNIPDSYYFEELKIGNITIPAFVLLQNTSLNYNFKIVSNFSKGNVIAPQSSFNFTIEHRTKNATITVKYSDMSITRESRAYLQINTTQTNYTMQIDLDNDGVIDATKQPDTVITDYAPAAIILSPSDGSVWDQGQSITFSGAGADREDGTLTGLTWISDMDGIIGRANFTTSNLSAGIHNITLLVNDTSGQINTSKIILIVRDTTSPVIKIEYPPENKIFNKPNVSVNGIAYDDSGILNVRVNGIQAGKKNWNTILEMNEGENRIEVVATDNNGFGTATYRTIYYNRSLASDTNPPAAITNLTHKTGYDNTTHGWINWTWDNPKDEDFSYVSIYLDNILMENTSRSYFSISGLSRDAEYNISILSADIVDNINYTDVKDTVLTTPPDTLPDTQPTTVITLPGTPGSDGPDGSSIPSPVPSPITDPPAQIPEFPTIALPIISAIGIMLLIARRK